MKDTYYLAITTLPGIERLVRTVVSRDEHDINIYTTTIVDNSDDPDRIGKPLDYKSTTVDIIQAIIGHGEAVSWLAEQERA